MDPMNKTAGEQWDFDSQHAEFTLTSGSRYMINDYTEESSIVSCPRRGARGTWWGDGFQARLWSVSGHVARRASHHQPRGRRDHGFMVMDSLAPPRYENNEV